MPSLWHLQHPQSAELSIQKCVCVCVNLKLTSDSMPQSIQSEFKPIKTSCYRKFQALKVSLQCVCNFAGSKQVAVGDSLPVSICFDKPDPRLWMYSPGLCVQLHCLNLSWNLKMAVHCSTFKPTLPSKTKMASRERIIRYWIELERTGVRFSTVTSRRLTTEFSIDAFVKSAIGK